jgi:spermidine/putrescine ABC transporter ATP-binding subunit
MASKAATLELAELTKFYGTEVGVGPVSLTVQPGEFVSLLGPSGCGKTTTLRLIAGLERPTSGTLRIDGEVVNDTPPHHRNIGLVFQNYALFPHLTIFDNVAFGLRYRKVAGTEREDRVRGVLRLVGLEGLDRRTPNQLSGGQQQRVALARAIVISPRILLFDEPLSNLDLALRQRMQEEIKRIQREVGITTLYVTHDQNEAFALSDRIAIVFRGRLHQYAEPNELYEHPTTVDVADFIGEINYLEGELKATAGGETFTTDRGTMLVVQGPRGSAAASRRRVAIRPHRVRLLGAQQAVGTGNIFVAQVEQSVYSGDRLRATVRLPAGDILQISVQNVHEARTALLTDTVTIQLRPEDLQFFPIADSRRM